MSMNKGPKGSEGDKPLGEKIESLRVRDLKDGQTAICVGSRLIYGVGIKYAEAGYVEVEGVKVVVVRGGTGFLLSATLPDGSSTVVFPAIWIEGSNVFKKGAVMKFKLKGENVLGLRYFDFVVGEGIYLDKGEREDDIHTRETEGMRGDFKKGVEVATQARFEISAMKPGDTFRFVDAKGVETEVVYLGEMGGLPVFDLKIVGTLITEKCCTTADFLEEGMSVSFMDDQMRSISQQGDFQLNNLRKVK